MEYSEFLAGSEQLLLSREFKELEERLTFREPNLWQILGISRKETLVSQFLSWLLDPGKEHNFGDQFLKSLILEALKTDTGRQNRLSPVQFFVMNLSEVEISTESWLQTVGHKRSRCDIIINDRKAGFLCIIENKVGANESGEQTKYYHEHSSSRFPGEQFPHRVYIYLSPYGVPPKSKHFIPLSYQAVLNAIKELQMNGRITETEEFLLRQFQENLQMSIVTDKETLDLAQEIYDTYGPIIDFIYNKAEDRTEASTPGTDWDGKSWFFNIGEVGLTPYSWDDSRKYSLICAGGASRYRKIMQKFKPGDVIYAYVSGHGYVGVGTVIKAAVPFREAILGDGKTKLMELQQAGMLAGVYDDSLDDDKCEWIVLVKWDRAVDKNQAVRLSPIVPSTASRIYDHRKGLIDRVRRGLGVKSTA